MADEQNPTPLQDAAALAEGREHIETPEDLTPPTQGEQSQGEEESTRPPKGPQDYIMERLQRKKEQQAQELAELKSKLDSLQQDQPKEKTQTDDLNPLAKEVMDELVAEKRDLEIRNWIAGNPEFQKYEEKMLAWTKESAWKQIPAAQLAYAVAGPELSQHIHTIKSQADIQAEQSRPASGALTGSKTSGVKNIWDMSESEFNAEVDRVRRQ